MKYYLKDDIISFVGEFFLNSDKKTYTSKDRRKIVLRRIKNIEGENKWLNISSYL